MIAIRNRTRPCSAFVVMDRPQDAPTVSTLRAGAPTSALMRCTALFVSSAVIGGP